jgi:NADPH2:quinone reductase
LGDDAKGWAESDEVMGLAFTWVLHGGTCPEFAAVKTESIARKPSSFSFAAAAAMPLVSLTSWQSLKEFADIQPGQTALIQTGAGGIGRVVIPMAKHPGAKAYTTCSAGNKDYVCSLGADHAIDYNQEDYGATLRGLEPAGLDVILETQEITTLPVQLSSSSTGL